MPNSVVRSFVHPKYKDESGEGARVKAVLAGSFRFQVAEIEVFQVRVK